MIQLQISQKSIILSLNHLKEDLMKVKRNFLLLGVILSFLLLSFYAEAKRKVEWVGKETLNFTLPSTEDRVINYAEEYYGKYHLIITFFPAAFTPI